MTLFIALLVLALVLFELGRFGLHLWRARELAAASEAFERRPPAAQRRLLVVGDSTAVGTGAAGAEDSVAGRLAARYPGVAVVNRGADGARMAGVIPQLRGAPEGPYDAVLVQAGGNDILRFTPLDALRQAADAALALAAGRGDYVVMMSTGAVGTAPAFPAAIGWLMNARTRAVREVLMEAADAAAVAYVDLYRPPEQDPFLKDPGRYYARDGLHPSGAGYALWVEELLAQSNLGERLGQE